VRSSPHQEIRPDDPATGQSEAGPALTAG
jgi:hypothetical protein